MTSRWLTLNAAAARISQATGEHVSIEDVLLLGERHRLTVRWQHEHYSVLEDSVTAYLAYQAAKPLAAHGGDDQTAPAPSVGRWSRADDPEAFADRADHDTPNDEGDEQ